MSLILPSMISVRAISATPMLGRTGISGERPLLSCLTRWETKLTSTSGSLTISEALSRRSLFIGEPGNRESDRTCSNATTFLGSMDGSFSLKTVGCGSSRRVAGQGVKTEIWIHDKTYLVLTADFFLKWIFGNLFRHQINPKAPQNQYGEPE